MIGLTAVTGLAGLSACSALKPKPVAPTLLISTPQAAAGLDSPHILCVRQAHRLAYFAQSEWADTPARMMAPLIVAALDRAGWFRAVVSTPTAVKADLRLDTEVVRLQHHVDATPSQVRPAR